MDVFKSKIDKWLFICLIFSVVACLLGASVMLEEGGALYTSIAVITIIAGAGFPLWIFTSTKYIVRKAELKIVSGPFSWAIPIKSIKSVEETQSTITGPALSFDRLEIIYGEDKVIIVSPVDKMQLIQKLEEEGLIGTVISAEKEAAEKRSKKAKKQLKKQKKLSHL
ncbi:MAG: PH domain-containing protein [Nitrosomonas sp.]|nr:PH domain-containing protein [Nitrosomonas sp.]